MNNIYDNDNLDSVIRLKMNYNTYDLESISISANILAQASSLIMIQTYTTSDYSPNFYDYYYDVTSAAGTVYVRQASNPETILYQTTTTKSVQSFCYVDITPCNSN